MASIWKAIASMVYKYGQYGAGALSFHGGYEAEVPAALKEMAENRK